MKRACRICFDNFRDIGAERDSRLQIPQLRDRAQISLQGPRRHCLGLGDKRLPRLAQRVRLGPDDIQPLLHNRIRPRGTCR
ncbi:MAG: hypothetical protein LBK99_08535 [Opitutaceae bacterium]|nr:hypothetical protein [Opitutaceae bacterium]